MITLNIPRQYAESLRDYFFPDINLYKESRLNTARSFSTISEEYLSACVINCVLTEVEHLVKKKLITTTGRSIKFQFSDAQGIVLYKTLIAMAIPKGNVYFDMMRNQIVQVIDQQLTKMNIHQTAKDRLSTV
jgi:hypothetical protein